MPDLRRALAENGEAASHRVHQRGDADRRFAARRRPLLTRPAVLQRLVVRAQDVTNDGRRLRDRGYRLSL